MLLEWTILHRLLFAPVCDVRQQPLPYTCSKAGGKSGTKWNISDQVTYVSNKRGSVGSMTDFICFLTSVQPGCRRTHSLCRLAIECVFHFVVGFLGAPARVDVRLIVEAPQGSRALWTERVTESNMNVNTYRSRCVRILCYTAPRAPFVASPLVLPWNCKGAATFVVREFL